MSWEKVCGPLQPLGSCLSLLELRSLWGECAIRSKPFSLLRSPEHFVINSDGPSVPVSQNCAPRLGLGWDLLSPRSLFSLISVQLLLPLSLFKVNSLPNMGLDLTTARSRVACSTNGASQMPYSISLVGGLASVLPTPLPLTHPHLSLSSRAHSGL